MLPNDRTGLYCALSKAEVSMVRHHLTRLENQASTANARATWAHIDAIKGVIDCARAREFEEPFRLRGDE